jgi:C-terminal peptidase prc
VIAAAAVLALPASAAAQGRRCVPVLQNGMVRFSMQDLYLWYRQIPDVDITKYPSPEAYLEAIRYRPLDSTFSYITSRAVQDAFFRSSQFIGFGFSTTLTEAGGIRITEVFAGSPAQQGGIARGDQIVAIDGRSVTSLASSGELPAALGPAESGVVRELLIVRQDGEQLGVRLVKQVVTVPTVSLTRVFDVAGRRVGYLNFRDFVEPSVSALDAAFAQLRSGGATELVIDLRYNGGGLVSVAQHLGSLIGGARTSGQVFTEFVHNDRNRSRNQTVRFTTEANALSLDRVLVITTRASASASELVINALRPFITVVTVGDRTYGKPVGQYPVNFCSKVLAAVAFAVRNANGEGDYFDGLPPTCSASDDLDHQLGSPEEASLHEALAYVATGKCSAVAPVLAPSSRGVRPLAEDGLRELLIAD